MTSAFRAQQELEWIHQQGVDEFDAMTRLSKALREPLKADARPGLVAMFSSMESLYGLTAVSFGAHLVRRQGGALMDLHLKGLFATRAQSAFWLSWLVAD